MRCNRFLGMLLLGAVFFTGAGDGHAGSARFDVSVLRKMPVLSGGRVKPFETFARSILLKFSGRTKYEQWNAVEWVARTLFDEEQTADDRVFLVNHPDILTTLDISAAPRRRYAFSDFRDKLQRIQAMATVAYQKEAAERTVVEKEWLRLNDALVSYTLLRETFAPFREHPDFALTSTEIRDILGFPDGTTAVSLYELFDALPKLRRHIDGLYEKDADSYGPADREAFRLMTNIYRRGHVFNDGILLNVPSWFPDDERWYSPENAVFDFFQHPPAREEFELLNRMRTAYGENPSLFGDAAEGFIHSVSRRSSDQRAVRWLPLEMVYNTVNPFFWAGLLYFGTLLLILFLPRGGPAPRLVVALMACGFILHTAGILTRVFLLARPPVSNLYETFIFVGWLGVIFGRVIERFQRHQIGHFTGAFLGFLLILVSYKFSADGDTLKMVEAVLDSNFWLTTHVLTITAGYTGGCVASVLGHLYLFNSARAGDRREFQSRVYLAMLGGMGFCLLFSVAGTLLGGIWADQSWGRFWGWDPKENGALMIILWFSMIFHARLAGLIDAFGVAVMNIAGGLVILWAWLGVNFLSVGLHSYGFTSGALYYLISWVFIECLFIVVCMTRQNKMRMKCSNG